MELDKALEPTREWYWMEMGGVGRKIVEEFFPIKPGENVVVTAARCPIGESLRRL